MKIDKAKTREATSKLNPIKIGDNLNGVLSVFNEEKKGEYYLIPLENLLPYHKQARKSFDEEKITQLAATINDHGIRQPLTVIKSIKQDGKFEIISGERRFRAAKLLDLKTVPCIILNDSSKAEEIAIIENIQREDLHPIELGTAYMDLAKQRLVSLNKLSDSLGVSPSVVKEHVKWANIEEEVKNLLISNDISERRILRKISSLSSSEERLVFVNAEVSKRTSNIGKAYKTRKLKLLTIEMIDGKLNFESRGISRLSDSQQEEVRKFIEGVANNI